MSSEGGPAEGRPPTVPPLSGRERLGVAVAAFLLRLLLRALVATCRFSFVAGVDCLLGVRSQGERAIFSFWHSQIFPFADLFHRRLLHHGYPVAMLSSWSRDGELGARLGRGLGALVARGSSTHGGTAGLRGLYRMIRAHQSAAVTLPDGPKGPPRVAKAGTAVLAQLTGLPIIPLGLAISRSWQINSWDRMLVPKPFSHIVVACGEPIEVLRGASSEALEATRTSLQTALDDLTASAEAQLFAES